MKRLVYAKPVLGGTLALLAASTLLFAACGSSGDDDDPGDDDDSATSTPSPERTRTPNASPTPESKVPTLADGKWTAGEAEATVSGGATLTLKGTLNNQASSDKGTTRLIFVDGVKTITISISKQYQPFAGSVYDGKTSIRTGNSDEPCKVEYKQADDKRIEGSFHCEDARIEVGGAGAAVIDGTFFATR